MQTAVAGLGAHVAQHGTKQNVQEHCFFEGIDPRDKMLLKMLASKIADRHTVLLNHARRLRNHVKREQALRGLPPSQQRDLIDLVSSIANDGTFEDGRVDGDCDEADESE